MQPTHLRVSMTIPKRGISFISRLLDERDEVAVDAGAAHQRIRHVLGGELRGARALQVRALLLRRRVAEAVHEIDTVRTDALCRLHLDAVAYDTVLVLELHELPIGDAELLRDRRIHPH